MRKYPIKMIVWAMLFAQFYTVSADAAPIAHQQDRIEQHQEAKRQAQEENARLHAPYVTLQEETAKSSEIQLPKEDVDFWIKKIEIETAHEALKPFKGTLSAYENRRVGIQGINLLTKLLSERLIGEGYITTKVIVPQQKLASGTLRLVVVPGMIGQIRFEDPGQYGTWRNAFPTAAGELLNVRRLEQGLEQMKRVPNQDVKMRLIPGEKEGESDVIIKVVRTKPWAIGFSIDDSGLESVGRFQASVNAAFYNPTGFNDILSYSYGKDIEHEDARYGGKNYSFSYSIPYGFYTFNFVQYRNLYHQTVADIVPFVSSGKTDGMEIGVERLLYRDRLRKTQALFKVMRKERHNYIDNEELLVQKQKTTAYQVGIVHRQYYGANTIDFMLCYQQGMPWWGAEDGYGDYIDGQPTTRYGLWDANLHLAVPVAIGKSKGNYTFTFRGQYTGDVLYGSDQFSIGGRYSVRGFDGEQSLAAENGFYLRNELSFSLEKLPLQPYIGIDIGHVWGPSAQYLLGKNLAGAVAGLRGNLSENMYCDFFIGAPLYKPKGFKTAKATVGFNLYINF